MEEKSLKITGAIFTVNFLIKPLEGFNGVNKDWHLMQSAGNTGTNIPCK